MQHVPEGVIQAPESPDAPEALPGCRSISDDDLCAWCTRLLYRPGEISLCRLSIQAMASGHPSVTGTVTRVTNGAIVIHTQRLKSDPGGNLLS